MNSNLKNALADFQTEIQKMQNELAEYQKKPGHSQKFAAFKKVRIKIMQNFLDCFFDQLIENEALIQSVETKNQALNTKVFKLEATCLLHGLGGSIFTYLQMPEKSLGELVKKCYSQKWRQTPLELHPNWPGQIPVKIATRPCISFEALKTKAANEPGWLTKFKTEINQQIQKGA